MKLAVRDHFQMEIVHSSSLGAHMQAARKPLGTKHASPGRDL